MVRSDVRAIDENSHELLSGTTCRTGCVQISYKIRAITQFLTTMHRGRPEESGRWKMYTHSMSEDFGIGAGCLGPGQIMMGRWYKQVLVVIEALRGTLTL